MKVSIKIASVAKKNIIRDLTRGNLSKIAVAGSVKPSNLAHLPLKESALKKLKEHIEEQPIKALISILSGESLPRGVNWFILSL